jgi:hypothetical protein
MKLFIMQFPPISCHIIPLWSKNSPQHPVLKHPRISTIYKIKTIAHKHLFLFVYKSKVKLSLYYAMKWYGEWMYRAIFVYNK